MPKIKSSGSAATTRAESTFFACSARSSRSARTVPRTERLAILTNGGGVGIIATDLLIDEGGELAPLADKTMASLDAVLPRIWSRANPVDIGGDSGSARYAAAFEALLADADNDAVLVMNVPTALASPIEAATTPMFPLPPCRRSSVRGNSPRPCSAAAGKHPARRWRGNS